MSIDEDKPLTPKEIDMTEQEEMQNFFYKGIMKYCALYGRKNTARAIRWILNAHKKYYE